MKILLTGDSHLGGLRRAQMAGHPGLQGADTSSIEIQALGRGFLLRSPFFAARDSHVEITEPEYRERVKRLPPPGPLPDLIGICGPLNTNRLWRDPDFKNCLPYPLAPTHALVSRSLLRAAIEGDARQSIEFAKALQRHVPVFVLEAPWPFLRHPAVTALGRDVVQHLHHAYRDHVLAELRSADIPVVEIDPGAVDAHGFMLPAFRQENGRDLYHANAAFGAVMLRAILARFDPARLQAGHPTTEVASLDAAP
ncbi:hypothetical protein [Ideonella sp.]|uniref:hypothetical protein n=1 Tax=Ideonella sp. TaxID=1929293 RepID=UPI0035B259E9